MVMNIMSVSYTHLDVYKRQGYDGEYLNVGNSVALYSLANSTTALSIQGRSLPFSDLDEVPLGFYAATTGSFTINLYDFDGLFLNQNIYLKAVSYTHLDVYKRQSKDFKIIKVM